jgi:xylulokinase
MAYIIAHDLGTSSHKCTIFDLEGRIIATSSETYSTLYKEGCIAEQDPDTWWDAVAKTSRRVLERVETNQVLAVSFSGHMMGCLPVNHEGTPLHPSLIHADTRSKYLEEKIFSVVDERTLYQITGNRINSHYPLLKMLWLKENRPDIYKKTAYVLQAKDYLIFKMTGNLGVTDYSDASLSGMFNLQKRSWEDTLIRELALDNSKLPKILPSSTVVGRVTAEAARATHLLEGTPVILGGGDGACATLGAGAYREGDTYIYFGTTAWVSRVVSEPLIDPEMRVFTLCDLNEHYYNTLGTMQTAGAAYQWAVEQLGKYELESAKNMDENVFSLLEKELEKVPMGSRGLIFHPYLLGERSPIWNHDARGTFFGLHLSHTRFDMIRAVLEGISYALASIAEVLEQEKKIDHIQAIGGGMKSKVLREILANVLQKPIQIPQMSGEATSLGAAIAGGVGIGIYKDYEEAMQKMDIKSDEILPGPEGKEVYTKGFKLFKKLYEDLRENYLML